MRISLNWLKDYLDIKKNWDSAQISESLTMAGLEVESIEHIGERAKHVHIARIEEQITIKDIGSAYVVNCDGESLRVTAPITSLAHGSFVAVIKNAKKGKVDGRLASFNDLGLLSTEIIAFDAAFFSDFQPELLSEMPEFDDFILSLGITPNRSDALSHLGVARELAAILDLPIKSPILSVKEMAGPTHEKAVIEIESSDDCPRYSLRVLENVKVTESPLWLKTRLLACGVRPINNVVDVTNFVMLSRGQPMHAFDFDTLVRDDARTKITVRRARAQEKLHCLDQKEIELKSDDLIIADRKGPIALAGIIGGTRTAVQEDTVTVLLESAYFNPLLLRKTARHHSMSTESSYRFERGVDPNAVVDALNYAARLLVEMGNAKSCREVIDAYRKRIDPIEIKMRPERAQDVLGMTCENFDQDLLRRKFLRLGIETVAKRGDAIYFRVPTFRNDLTREIDLIEEAARMLGYDKIGDASDRISHENNVDLADKQLTECIKKIRQHLFARGFYEARNYSFLSRELHYLFSEGNEEPGIELLNPLSERYSVMRRSLLPGLIKNLMHNLSNQEKSLQLFEMGTVFLGKRPGQNGPRPEEIVQRLNEDSYCLEAQMFSAVMCGKIAHKAFDHVERDFDFYDLKGFIAEFLSSLSLSLHPRNPSVFIRHGAKKAFLHPGASASLFLSKDATEAFGHFGRLHPDIAEKLGLSHDVLLFEIALAPLSLKANELRRYQAFSRFPTIARDLALVLDENHFVGELIDLSYELGRSQDLVKDATIFDIYRGKNIAEGKKSVAISFILQGQDRTLTDQDADSFIEEFLQKAQEKFDAKVR
jgi:phenylalanyl-tRNA synthetase beta chain